MTSDLFPGPQPAFTYTLGDGGNVDNSGLLVSLQRKAKRIIWLINTEIPLPDEFNVCDLDEEGMAWNAKSIEFQLTANFGFYKDNDVGQFLASNQVFSHELLAPLLCDLRKLRDEGKPSIVKKRMTVLDNTWWKITSYVTTVVVVYSEKSSNFEAMLPEDTKKDISWGAAGGLANYPHYGVVFQNVGELTALTNAQVNLLAAQSEYAILQNAALFKELLSSKASTCPTDTGGSCRIFNCRMSRNAVCEKHRCVCASGQCADNGRCEALDDTSIAASFVSSQSEATTEDSLFARTSVAGIVAMGVVVVAVLRSQIWYPSAPGAPLLEG